LPRAPCAKTLPEQKAWTVRSPAIQHRPFALSLSKG